MASLNMQKYNGALFTVAADRKVANGPLMTGLINLTEKDSVEMAAFIKTGKESGKEYLSLKIQTGKGDTAPLYGRLFRTEAKKSDKAADYFGAIDLGAGDNAPELRIAGWKRTSKDGKTQFVSLLIDVPNGKPESATPPAAEAAPGDAAPDLDIPF